MNILNPSSIAVIGASSHEGKVGHDVLKNLVEQGYNGDIFPVNPKGGEILGKKVYASITDISTTPDLAIIVIPAELVPKALKECGEKDVKNVIVISAGFSEVHTDEGQKLEEELKEIKPHRIYLSPRGERLTQPKVESLATTHEWLILLCGHYEGIDQRIIDGGYIDEEISIGDYVLTGGELPAMVLIDAVARHIPGVLGHDESAQDESFSASLDRKKEYPHYTRPEEFNGMRVPDVLLSGNHAEIEKWRKEHTH